MTEFKFEGQREMEATEVAAQEEAKKKLLVDKIAKNIYEALKDSDDLASLVRDLSRSGNVDGINSFVDSIRGSLKKPLRSSR